MGVFDSQGNGSGSGFGGRILIGIVIAAVGYFMYLTHVQENPVTGESQHISISPDQEIRLGLASAPAMAREMGGEVPASDPKAKEVQSIGGKLLSTPEAQRSPWKYQFHLLADDQTVNAFALPGGQIFITLGLYNKLQTEAQLAGVLSHEMGHVIERHTAQQMAKGELGQYFVVAVGAAASDRDNPIGSYTPVVIANVINNVVQLRYSRKDESQADIWGLKLMTEVGYDPRAMIQVMEVLKASAGGGHMPEFFQTHPNPDLRILQINAYLKENPPKEGLTQGAKLP